MKEQAFESYDYLKVTVEDDLCSQYIDGYTSLGWKPPRPPFRRLRL